MNEIISFFLLAFAATSGILGGVFVFIALMRWLDRRWP